MLILLLTIWVIPGNWELVRESRNLASLPLLNWIPRGRQMAPVHSSGLTARRRTCQPGNSPQGRFHFLHRKYGRAHYDLEHCTSRWCGDCPHFRSLFPYQIIARAPPASSPCCQKPVPGLDRHFLQAFPTICTIGFSLLRPLCQCD